MTAGHRDPDRLALAVPVAILAEATAGMAHVIGRLEEALALGSLPAIDGIPPPSREALIEALAEARAIFAALRRRLS